MGDELGTFSTIEAAHETLRGYVHQATESAMRAVITLAVIRERELYRDAFDDDGEPFHTWSAYLKWAQKEFRLSRALAYEGLKAYQRLTALHIAEDILVQTPPTTLKRISDSLIIDGQWRQELVDAAAASSITVEEKVEEILALPPADLYAEVQSITRAPSFYAVVKREGTVRTVVRLVNTETGEMYELSGDAAIDHDMALWLARRLRCAFEEDNDFE